MWKSLFNNVPIKRTVDIILRRIYQDRVISTNLKKRTLMKLMLDTCTKTVFSFNNKFYQQKDRVSTGSSLGPVLANIIMTELEDVIIKPLIADGTIKFYSRFVDDTLLVMKAENVSQVHKALNKFDNNLRFTVDMFQNEIPDILGLELSPDGITIFRKDTNTLISQALCLGHIVLHGLEALLHVLPVFTQKINCRLKSTPLKDWLRGMIFLSQLLIQ